MRLRLIGAGIAVVAILGIAIRADDSRVPTTTASRDAQKTAVKKLISQLGSESRKDRVNAERKLLKIGPAVLPFLPPPELTPNLSAREAVRRIRVQLEHRKASESVKPSRVTLTGVFSLETVLRSIAAQTGNRIDSSTLPKSVRELKLKCDYRKKTFWSVIEDLTRRGLLEFDIDSDRLKTRAASRSTKPRRVFADNSTAFRIVVDSVTTNPVFTDRTKRLLRVSWKITAEPRLRPLFLKYAGTAITAGSGQKQFPAFDPDARYELPLGEGGRRLSLRSEFLVSRFAPPTSVRVRGAIRVQTAAASEPIEFRRLAGAEGTAKRRGGVTVTLRRTVFGKKRKNGGRNIKVRVAVGYDTGGPAFESHRTWIFHNRVYLLAKGGKQVPHAGGSKTTLQDDGAVGVEYNFDVPGGSPSDYRFVYVAPTLLINVPIQFDIAKIPLSRKQKESRRK